MDYTGNYPTFDFYDPLIGPVHSILIAASSILGSDRIVVNYTYTRYGNWLASEVKPASVPAPATLTILSLGLAGFGLARRKKT